MTATPDALPVLCPGLRRTSWVRAILPEGGFGALGSWSCAHEHQLHPICFGSLNERTPFHNSLPRKEVFS